jgi:hypothetical protein
MATKNTKTEMKERPILFSGPMVRAILEGRKTQTRRVVKDEGLPPSSDVIRIVELDNGEFEQFYNEKRSKNWLLKCPYGQPGDRLWVRETFAVTDGCSGYEYPFVPASPVEKKVLFRASGDRAEKWRPSIFMPRWASRITLEIVSIRVERLQDVSEADAKVEGADTYNAALDIGTKGTPRLDAGPFQKGYALLWGEINGPGSWASNPWVWVVEFRRCQSEVA